jgi:hypothetical protein
MGNIKRRNRPYNHKSQHLPESPHHHENQQSVVFFEHLVQQEVQKALSNPGGPGYKSSQTNYGSLNK